MLKKKILAAALAVFSALPVDATECAKAHLHPPTRAELFLAEVILGQLPPVAGESDSLASDRALQISRRILTTPDLAQLVSHRLTQSGPRQPMDVQSLQSVVPEMTEKMAAKFLFEKSKKKSELGVLMSQPPQALPEFPPGFIPPREFVSKAEVPRPVQAQAPTLKRIFVGEGKSAFAISAIALTQPGLFLTCAHVIEFMQKKIADLKGQNPTANVGFFSYDPSQDKIPLELEILKIGQPDPNSHLDHLVTDNSNDLALLKIKGFGDVPGLDISDYAEPTIGQQAYMPSFPMKSSLIRSVRNNGIDQPDYSAGELTKVEPAQITTTLMSYIGSSGSPALTAEGKFLGLIWGSDDPLRRTRDLTEETKLLYKFGLLQIAPSYSYFIPARKILEFLNQR